MSTNEKNDSYVARLSSRLISLYLDVLKETDPDAAALIAQKRAIQDGDVDKKATMRAYIDFWNGLDEAQQLALASHDAKINQLSRVVRTMGTTAVVQAHNSIKPSTAGSIDFVLGRFREACVTACQVQKFIDENAQAWFSLTGHPTNPATVVYTIAQADVARVIARDESTVDDLRAALRALRDTPIVGERKTPLQEAEETLNTLDTIYDTALAHKKLFEDALEKHGYAAEGVKVTKPLIHPCVWTLGDGDGNDNMTAKVLEDGIALHRERIAARYKRSQAAGCGAEDLSYLKECFGDGFARIDIRHNAVDIMASVTALFHLHKLMDKDRFGGMTLDEKAIVLSAWLKDDEVIKILSGTKLDDLDGAAQRILGRLRVIGKNPDMCEKLIIAETTHPAHALAALLLLKISGNEVASDQGRIDLVILSESVADLADIGSTLENLLHDETFRRHVACRGRLVAMIAKSDTTRQDGRGEAEYAQYEAAVDVYRVADRVKQKYPELASVLVSVKNGGGHALQRGGGRVTEIPALHGRAAADARVTDIGPSTLTIQGQQQTVLFCPGRTALGTLEALAAQNLYTKAGIFGEMQPPAFSRTINRQYARADARLYARVAGQAFDRITVRNPAIDELLVAAPWLAMKAGNASSRPAKRGEKPVEPGITPAEAKGENPRALAGRAISGERLTAHACLPVFSVLGLLEAMNAVRSEGSARMNPKKYGEALHHLYRAHKIHRDSARATINAVAMAEFDIAWPLLTGMERPSKKKVAALAARFQHSDTPHANPPEVTLAFLEDYFLKVEIMTYEMITGQKAKKGIRHGEGFRRLWPDLAAQVEERDRHAGFARVIECYRTRRFDEAPDVPLSERAFRITQALYASANVVSAPVGILATRTRLEPVYEVGSSGRTRFMRPESYGEEQVQHLLPFPACLGSG